MVVGKDIVVLFVNREDVVHWRDGHVPGVEDFRFEFHAVAQLRLGQFKNPICRLLPAKINQVVFTGLAADLLIDGELIVELKACKALTDEHVAQLLGYLRGCRVEHGLLINFGSSKLEVRKYILNDAV